MFAFAWRPHNPPPDTVAASQRLGGVLHANELLAHRGGRHGDQRRRSGGIRAETGCGQRHARARRAKPGRRGAHPGDPADDPRHSARARRAPARLSRLPGARRRRAWARANRSQRQAPVGTHGRLDGGGRGGHSHERRARCRYASEQPVGRSGRNAHKRSAQHRVVIGSREVIGPSEPESPREYAQQRITREPVHRHVHAPGHPVERRRSRTRRGRWRWRRSRRLVRAAGPGPRPVPIGSR